MSEGMACWGDEDEGAQLLRLAMHAFRHRCERGGSGQGWPDVLSSRQVRMLREQLGGGVWIHPTV
jgi:hypothetical protein